MLKAGGEDTVEKGPGEGGLFPSKSPKDGVSWNLLLGAALPAAP